jgi:serine/threonine-protein kinase
MAASKNRWPIILAVAVMIVAVLAIVALIAFWPVVVPNVTSMPIAQATAVLEQSGLRVGKASQVATVTLGTGRVVEQNPGFPTTVLRRSSVELTLAVNPMPAPVPDVTGRDATLAEQTLAGALYLPQRVEVFGTKTKEGIVIEQVPVAGTSWTTGRPVAIAVAAASNEGTGVEVPDLTGKSIDVASAELAKLGLGVSGFVTNISNPQANVVVDQLPAGGLLVGSGTTVLLLFEKP